MRDIAIHFKERGYMPLPVGHDKAPVKGCMWKTWAWDRILEEFSKPDVWGIAIRTEGFEVIDIDNYLGNADRVLEHLRNTNKCLSRASIAKSQSYGYHIYYRSDKMEGNKKLAYMKDIYGNWQGVLETRGKGGFIVVAPSKGYEFIQNDLDDMPTFTKSERTLLWSTCRGMNQRPVKKERLPQLPLNDVGIIEEARGCLQRAGWKFDGRHVTRPGKRAGTSATFGIVAPGKFYVFTANGGEFEPERGYEPWHVIAKLMFNGDFKAAGKYCREKYG